MIGLHDKPRPDKVCILGFLTVELGKAKRICRGCRISIPKGTYHIAIATTDSMASLKFCEDCIKAAAGWCKTSNRRNL